MRKLVATCVVTIAMALGLSVAPAAADHTHVIRHKDGSCTILAKNGGERYVVLPEVNPNVDPATAENRKHPHHLFKHLKLNGNNSGSNVVAVMGPNDGCAYYKNG